MNQNRNVLFQPLKIGDFVIQNRIGMAALTRQRCNPDDGIPNDLVVQYYTQRGDAGFILTEATGISKRCGSFPGSAGIYTEQQIEGWKKVIDSVHQRGAKMILQIWHSGRNTHSTLQGGLEPWAPSPIKNRWPNRAAGKDHEIPHEMTKDEIQQVICEFRQGAQNAKKAGFDAIQIHGAHGYLIDEFLRDCSNTRTDEYGGSIENRCRFCLEVVDEIINVFGAGRVGLKISPIGRNGDMFDSDPVALFTYLFKELSKRNVAFIELKDDFDVENFQNCGYPSSKSQITEIYKTFRKVISGVIIGNNLLTPDTAKQKIENDEIDAVSFGKLYISNPDLVDRIRNGWELNQKWDMKTFYTNGPEGYIDYPLYQQQGKL